MVTNEKMKKIPNVEKANWISKTFISVEKRIAKAWQYKIGKNSLSKMSHGTSFEIDCTTLPRLSWSCLSDMRRLSILWPFGKSNKIDFNWNIRRWSGAWRQQAKQTISRWFIRTCIAPVVQVYPQIAPLSTNCRCDEIFQNIVCEPQKNTN